MGRKILFTLILACFTLAVSAQQKDTAKVRLNHYTLTIGAGWTHYINNLENYDNNIRQDFAGVSFKFFWEPEYRLSLGLESGYYELFKVTGTLPDNTAVEVNRVVVPLLLLVRMRIVDNVYLGAGVGMALLTNKTSGGDQKIVTKTTSLSNFELSGAYIYPLNKHMLVGGEMKMFSFGSYSDYMFSIQATFAFKL
ncbi:MAG: outer membrane beta-barrel protein [bacterium]